MPVTEAAGFGAPQGRRRARELALRSIYRGEVVGDPLDRIAAEVEADESVPPAVRGYAVHLISLVNAGAEEIDRLISGVLQKWSLDRLAVIDRSVLRIATAELLLCPDVPVAVVLDEAIEIARRFGSDESGGFVNGVLDKVAQNCRAEEDRASR
jgi:N utilization substance protein B